MFILHVVKLISGGKEMKLLAISCISFCFTSCNNFPIEFRTPEILPCTEDFLSIILTIHYSPLITADIHFYYGFVFTGCLIFSFFFVFFFVYETKGLSLEEVDELYSSGVLPWKSGGWVPPSKEAMATTTGYASESKPEEEHV